MEENKIYEFRKLKAVDVPIMLKIIKKIDIKKFTDCFNNNEVKKLIKETENKVEENNSTEENNVEDIDYIVGGKIFLDITQIILDGISECTNEVNKLLSQTSNLSVEQIENLDFDTYMFMIIDFIKKEEFVGFIKRVVALIK